MAWVNRESQSSLVHNIYIMHHYGHRRGRREGGDGEGGGGAGERECERGEVGERGAGVVGGGGV